MLFHDQISPCQKIDSRLFPDMQLWLKRDDLLHPMVSGNKFRKLKFPLLALQQKQQLHGHVPHIVSMGGIWSNHLHALAHAAAALQMPVTALVRGAEGMHSAMLDDCRQLGMQIQFVSREAYRLLREKTAWQQHITSLTPHHVWLPEGGSAAPALHGVAELIHELPFVPDHIVVACGTGATLAGLLAGLKGQSRVTGIATFQNADYLHQDIARLLQEAHYPAQDNYQLLTHFHHGGYGKVSPELLQFCADFYQETTIALEPVYTGKMLFAVRQLWLDGFFSPQERVVAIHTGGLQGARGFI